MTFLSARDDSGMSTVEYTVGTLGACAVAAGAFGIANAWFDDTFIRIIQDALDRTLLENFEFLWNNHPKFGLRP